MLKKTTEISTDLYLDCYNINSEIQGFKQILHWPIWYELCCFIIVEVKYLQSLWIRALGSWHVLQWSTV